MYAPRPPESFANTAPLANGDNTHVSHDHTGQAQSHAGDAKSSRRNDRKTRAAWRAVWPVVLVPGCALLFHYAISYFEQIFGPALLARVYPVEDVTLPIEERIIHVLDGYAPFLNPSTPLLKLGSVQLTIPDDSTGMNTAWLGGVEGNLEAWNLALTARWCLEICMSHVVTRSKHDSDLNTVCTGLQERLKSTRDGQIAVAYLLAGPQLITTPWLDLVGRALFDTLWPDSEQAAMLPGFVEEQGTWHAINNEMDRELLELRKNCTDIADDLIKLRVHYGQAVISAGQHDGGQHSGDGVLKSMDVPVAHIRVLISAIDDLREALKHIGLRVLFGLGKQPWARARLADSWRGLEAGRRSRDGKRVATRIVLPDPQRVTWNVHLRLSTMDDKRQKMVDVWNSISAADSRLVDCLKEEDEHALVTRLNMSRLNDCISEYAVVETRYWPQLEGEEADAHRQAFHPTRERLKSKFPDFVR